VWAVSSHSHRRGRPCYILFFAAAASVAIPNPLFAMKFDQLVSLLPCQSLEDFDLQRKEEDAEQLLSAWSTLWHPLLLASAGAIPRWLPATSPPPDPSNQLIILPDCCRPSLPEDWVTQAEAAGAVVLQNLANRDDMLAAALERLGSDQPNVDADLAADFLALGFCHLQVELLTRKLRYMSNLDAGSLQTAALSAADEALQGNAEESRRHLQSAFDRLHEAREYFYPTEARLLDLTLVAPSTLGPSLQAELASGPPRNLLVAAEVVEEMACREPATLEALRQALADHRAALIGGAYGESRLPLLDIEAIEEQLDRGRTVYEKHLQQHPLIFGRRQFGLTPVLPQILERHGFRGALHYTLDDGRFPTGNQSRIQWEGIDGTSIEAIGSLPIDAGRAESFLRIAEKLGDAMNLDHTATVMFAHWPGRSSRWYEDVRRIAAYGSVFGTFTTIGDYFENTSLAGHQSHYQPDEYRSPYLRQDITAGRRDPISRWVRYFRRRATLQARQTLDTQAMVCGVASQKREAESERRKNAEEFANAIEACLAAEDDTDAALDDRLAKSLDEPLRDFSRAVASVTVSPKRGCLIVNPWSFSQQAEVPRSSALAHPWSGDVPAMGFAWIDATAEPPPAATERKGWFGKRKPQAAPPLAEENVLRNEFFEVHFDPHTGGIRTISDYHSRNPRLAQQIALRLPHGSEPGADLNYSVMAADELTVTSAGPVLGEIVSRGRLMDREGHRVAGFRQVSRARRGSRILEIQIELEIDRLPHGNPWDSYYAARFAWKDAGATLQRGTNMARHSTELTQFESPHFVDICRDKQRTTLLCGGLPYHRRFGPRKLDTLLVTPGETARTFRLGIGIDVPNPMAAALGFLAPPLVLPDQPPTPSPTGWLFHLDCRNVLATHWEPLPAQASITPDISRGPAASREATARAEAGFRVRLLETDGRGVRLGLRCFRGVASAQKINPGDVPRADLVVEGDRIDIPLGPHQWIDIEARFAAS
jgi:alpha-mannosidase